MMPRVVGKKTASILVAVVLALVLFYGATLDLPAGHPATSRSDTSHTTGTSTTSSTETVGTVYPYGKNGGIINLHSLYPCNCSLYAIPTIFPTLQDMIENSTVIWLAKVTAVTVVAVKGAPFTVYSIEAVKDLDVYPGESPSPPGALADVAWFGGTVNGTTMTPVGYPTLSVGESYIFFLTPETTVPNLDTDYWQYLPSTPDFPFTLSTTGGAQGLFNIGDGKVYSLDNMYPQADSWLHVKVDGLPLQAFESEILNDVATWIASEQASEQVASAYADHLMQVEARNVTALVDGYESNATLEWTGAEAAGTGNYSGSTAINAMLTSFLMTKLVSFSLSNPSQSIVANNESVVVNSTFDFQGYSSVVGIVSGRVVAQDVYEHTGGSWLIARETWNFTQFIEQYPVT
jgi:hypothetical protein